MKSFEPKIIAFLCNWCSYECADSVGRAQKEYPSNLKIVRTMCSGRVDPQFILEAFQKGASGILILGCHIGDCHYKEGNVQAMTRYILLKELLPQFGIEKDRLRLDWVSATETEKFITIVTTMVEDIRQMGPLIARR
jgi:F420-non-reducing hydrogenase iron-sulfur subunit